MAMAQEMNVMNASKVAALLATICLSSGFTPTFVRNHRASPGCLLVDQVRTCHTSSHLVRYASDEPNIEDSDPTDTENENQDPRQDGTSEQAIESSVPPEMAVAPRVVTQKQLDPLVRSLTRTDPQSADAPTVQIPPIGELVLDKSLFVLVPVASFAVLGAVLALYIGLNAGDAFAEMEQAATLGQQSTRTEVSDDSCRGLCSSQEKDLEGLRVFMSNFAK